MFSFVFLIFTAPLLSQNLSLDAKNDDLLHQLIGFNNKLTLKQPY